MLDLTILSKLNFDSFEIKNQTVNNITFYKSILKQPLIFKFKGLKLEYF